MLAIFDNIIPLLLQHKVNWQAEESVTEQAYSMIG